MVGVEEEEVGMQTRVTSVMPTGGDRARVRMCATSDDNGVSGSERGKRVENIESDQYNVYTM